MKRPEKEKGWTTMSLAENLNVPIGLIYDSVCEKFRLGLNADDVRHYLRQQGLAEEIVKDLLSRYFAEQEEKNKEDVLVERAKFEDWYGGANEDPNSHWSKLKEVLLNTKNWSPDMIESIDSASTSVLSKIANPKIQTDRKYRIKGLVLGYVQSGKTSNYSAVIAKAIDAGYKFIVVLAGIHNNLRYQTEVRLKEDIIEPNETACITLTRTDKKGDFSKKESTSANKATGQEHGFSMAVIKKNAHVLRSFVSWISTAKEEYLDACPTLIIDDESDQASINTSKDPELNPTAINGLIRQIMSRFKVATYLGYTATPYANMLIDSNVGSDLFPNDFFISLRKPNSYTGAEELFGSFNSENSEGSSGLPLIREIDEDEANYISSFSRRKRLSNEPFQITDGIKTSIQSFVLGASSRIARGHWKEHFSMLLHSSYKIDIQSQIFKEVEKYVEELRFKRGQEDESLKCTLSELWKNDFLPTTREIDQDIAIQDFETIWKNTANILDFIQVILDNSDSDRRLSYEERFCGIVVGGNTLSRGLTLEGLLVSYFVRTSQYYDTLMQMGRWFGYRRGYLDLTRVFLSEDLKQRFFHLANVENEIREEIHSLAENQDRPIDVAVRIKAHPSMSVTNSMKMRSAKECSMTFSNCKVQPNYHVLSNPEILEQNKTSVNNLIKDALQFGAEKVQSKFRRFRESLLLRKVPIEVIRQFLDSFHISNANLGTSKENITEFISVVNSVIRLDDWSVALISNPTATEKFDLLEKGLDFGLSDRSVSYGLHSTMDQKAAYVKNISTPIDEFIDMWDLVDNCPERVDEFQMIEGKKRGAGYLRGKYRPQNRPLLLIYPLNPKSQSKERYIASSPYPLKPLEALDVVYAVCFVFPKIEGDVGYVKYVVNESI